ncbi:enoyl-CoA hydratase/isomerase family protein [Thermodesulfobacteriota bacterium]
MDYQTIQYSKEDGIGIIRLHRPERMNAVVEEMYEELQDLIGKAERDHQVRVLILTGSVFKKGTKEKQAFCAGADLKKHASGERTHAEKRQYIMLAHETTQRIYEFPKPFIAAVNGPARGAGVEMALNCDFIFMAENATLGLTETGLGTFVGGAITFHLPRMVGLTRAKELVYTGKIIDGRAALEMGLALGCFSEDDLLKETKAFAQTLADKAPLSMLLAKKRLQQPTTLDIETVLHLEAEAILSCMDTEDWHEGIRSFSEKRKPVFEGK